MKWLPENLFKYQFIRPKKTLGRVIHMVKNQKL